MSMLLGQRESTRTPASMADRVAADAKRAFSNRVDQVVIDRYVQQAVGELSLETVKVTTFVPVLAMRRVRELIESSTVTTHDVGSTR